MAHHLSKGDARSGSGESEFAATVLSMPAPESLPADIDPSLPPSDLGEAADPSETPTLSHIGRYALKRQLGQGGLGTVYEAWDPLLSRTVAVKTLQFDVDTPARVSLDGLFLNEARTAAGLSHPNIVVIHDAGLSAHGVYIAMERLQGRDLRQALAEGWRPTPAAAALLVRRVADALAYAHARAVVHCDIKPANIFITRRERPKVLDFGIARAAHSSALSDGTLAGSPHYLAPEQLEGGTVDARTDVYALGVVLYELLTGRKAFDGASLDEITAAVLRGQPQAVADLNPEVPAPLAAITARAMARSSVERHASALEMALELRRWLEHQPVAGTKTATEPKAPAMPRAVLLAGGVLLLGAALWAATVRREAPAAAPPAPAVASAERIVVPPLSVRGEPESAPPAAAPVAEAEAPKTAAPAPLPTAAPAPAARPPAAQAVPAKPRPAPAAAPARDTRPAPVPISAAPLAMGAVQLAISPWGHVEVDGKPAGTTPPLTRLTLPEGMHTITVRNEDFPPLTITVQVADDKPVTVRHRFGGGS